MGSKTTINVTRIDKFTSVGYFSRKQHTGYELVATEFYILKLNITFP